MASRMAAEIDDGGDAGEVLHEDAGGHVGDFAAGLGLRLPLGEELDVVGGDGDAVFAAQQVFEQYFQREGEAGDVEAVCGEGGERVVAVSLVAGFEFGGGAEGVHGDVLYLCGRGLERRREFWAAGILARRNTTV